MALYYDYENNLNDCFVCRYRRCRQISTYIQISVKTLTGVLLNTQKAHFPVFTSNFFCLQLYKIN